MKNINNHFATFVLLVLLLGLPCGLGVGDNDVVRIAKIHLATGLTASVVPALAGAALCSLGRGMRYAVLTLAWILYLVSAFLYIRFHAGINPRVISLVMQTDFAEAREFAGMYLDWKTVLWVLLMCAVPALLARAARLIPIQKMNRWVAVVMAVAVMAAGGVYFVQSLNPFRYYKNGIPTPLALWFATAEYLGDRPDFDALRGAIALVDGDAPGMSDSVRVVWVIGESFSKIHTPLYGYHLPTTPNLTAERDSGNLLVYDNVYTPSAYTGPVMQAVFTFPVDGERFAHPLVPMIFRHAGYRVSLYDNQTTAARAYLMVDHQNVNFLSGREVAQASLDYRNTETTTYDLEFMRQSLAATRPGVRSFDIYHLKGQHAPPWARYPAEGEIFGLDLYAGADTLDEYEKYHIAAYDNATRYNDRVLGELIASLRGSEAILVYHSDHGEEVFDTRHGYGRIPRETPSAAETNIYNVPFVVYTTPEFRARNPEIYQWLRASASDTLRLERLGPFLLRAGGIRSRYSL